MFAFSLVVFTGDSGKFEVVKNAEEGFGGSSIISCGS
jgi:hypothetical protein